MTGMQELENGGQIFGVAFEGYVDQAETVFLSIERPSAWLIAVSTVEQGSLYTPQHAKHSQREGLVLQQSESELARESLIVPLLES